MPSIQDVADQINAKLDQITSNTSATKTNTANIRDEQISTNQRLDVLTQNMMAGLSNLSNGLHAIHQVQITIGSILEHQVKQNDTLICLLEANNDMLCDIKRRMGKQNELTGAILASSKRIEGISERVNAEQAIAHDRQQEALAAARECCPATEPRPEPCPAACESPKIKIRKPDGQDWTPLPENPKNAPKPRG